MLTLKGVTTQDDGRVIKTVYEAQHCKPGRSGTTLRLDVAVEANLRFGRITASALVDPKVEGGTPEEALDKLADWAERLAIAIRHRGSSSPLVPVFNDPVRPEVPDETDSTDDAED